MTITGVVTGFMILISATFILTSIGDDLFTQRRDQVLEDAARATIAAQQLIDASTASDVRALSTMVTQMRRTVQDTSSSELMYVRRQPNQDPVADAPQDFTTDYGFVESISGDLQDAVMSGDNPQYWQSVQLPREDGSLVPGIVVGSTLTYPAGAGAYDLFIGYTLDDTESTYAFITRTLALTAVLLMLLIGVLVFSITRIVFRPIQVAADTSRRLAAGEADARMPLQGDENFDVLSENFNDMAETLQARIEELDELSEMQQRFVSDVSHELRTPLTTVKLATEVLASKADGLEGGQARAVQVMSEQVARFESLLGDLLEISRYDAGQVTISPEMTNMVTLVQEAVDTLRPLADCDIDVHIHGGYSPIEVDPRRIRRIVTNLIGNAIEHGEGHPVTVSMDSNESALAVTVTDQGIGMDTEALERVFERFWRADPSRKRTLGGTGLGLAIAREDATVHGGLLEVWSKPGVGTNFRLTLPRHDDDRSFISPLPLRPDGVTEDGDDEPGGGWLRRPLRRLRKGFRQ